MYMYPLRMYLTCRRVSYIVIVIPCPKRSRRAPASGRVVTVVANTIESDAESDVGQQDDLERARKATHSATRRDEDGEPNNGMHVYRYRVRRREERRGAAGGKEGTLVGFCAAFEHS